MATMAKIEVFLQDAETQQLYSVWVTAEEEDRLNRDITFATQKLEEAKNASENNIEHLPEAGNEDCLSASVESVGVFKWPHEAIMLLIEEYRITQANFISGKMSQKKAWGVIAHQMAKNGHNVTGPQCLSKFSGLKRTYKAVKDHNDKSGNGTRLWPYFSHMDTLLGAKPFMAPIATVSSTGKRTLAEASTSSSESCIDIEETSMPSTSKPKKFRRASNDGLEEVLKELKEEWKNAEDAIERRHKENIELKKKLLSSIDKMVEIWAKK